MKEKAVRYNLFVAATVFLNFWYLVISLRLKDAGALFVLHLTAPIATLLIPVLFYPLACMKSDGRKGFVSCFADCYSVKKCGTGNFLLSAIIGFALYLFYFYTYSSIVCFYEYATKTVNVYTGSVSFDGRWIAVWLSRGILVPALTELVFRGGGSAAYGETRLRFVVPVLFGLFLSFSTDDRIKWLFAGIFALAALNRSGSVLSAAAVSVLFSLSGLTVGNFFDLPFSFRQAVSVETALYYGFISAAVGVFALGAVVLGLTAMGGKAKGERKRQKLSRDGRITACALVIIYLVLALVSALI